MPSPDILSFAALLAPISEEAPTGRDPRMTPALTPKFDKIVEASRAAAAVEKQETSGDGGQTTPPAKLWGPVVAPATEFLTGQAKDLEIAGCLARSMIAMHGLPGLRDGLHLMRELVETYWDTLYPSADEDDEANDPEHKDVRLTIIERLQALPVLTSLRLAPITGPRGSGPFSCDSYQKATRQELSTGNESITEEGRQQKSKIIAAATESGADYYINLLEDIQLALGHMDALENILMEKIGSSGLILGKLREAVGEIERAVRDIGRGLSLDAASPAENGAADTSGHPGAPIATGGFRASGANATKDREGALRCLTEIAAFFKTTEPHSPIGYALDTVIARARMPLPALLEDLLSDDATRQSFLTTAGIRLPPAA